MISLIASSAVSFGRAPPTLRTALPASLTGPNFPVMSENL